MKNVIKNKLSLFTALFVAIMAVCLIPVKKVSAMEMSIPSTSGKTVCCMMIDKKNTEYSIYSEDLRKIPHGKNMTVLSFKSSNESVIKAWTEKNNFDNKTYPVLKLKKPGTAKLTLTYKSGTKKIQIYRKNTGYKIPESV